MCILGMLQGREYIEWQWPFSWRTFHHVVGVHANHLSLNLLSCIKLWCTLYVAERADNVHSPYFYSNPLCILWSMHCVVRNYERIQVIKGGGWRGVVGLKCGCTSNFSLIKFILYSTTLSIFFC
jgi:hypothetical protein